MQQIDHNPNEKRPSNGIWWILWIMIAFQWVAYFSFREPDWWSICIGGFTAGVLALWAIEMTGNKVPDWMK